MNQGDQSGGQKEQGETTLPDLTRAQRVGSLYGAGIELIAVDEQAAVRAFWGDDEFFSRKRQICVDGDEFFQNLIRVHSSEVFAVEQERNAGNAVDFFRVGWVDPQHFQFPGRLGQGKEDDIAVPLPIGTVFGGQISVCAPEELRKDAFRRIAVIHLHGQFLPDGKSERPDEGRQEQNEDTKIDYISGSISRYHIFSPYRDGISIQ